jgi:outer membrane protein assembly factor BamB
VLWRVPRAPGDADNVATPQVMGNKVFICTSYQKGSMLIQIGNLATSATIKTIWNNKTSVVVHFTTPLLKDGYLYAFDDRGYRCVKMETGEVKWTVPDIREGGQIMAEGLAYILDGRGKLILARLSPERMEKLSEVGGLVGPKCWTMPVVANGRLYLRDESKLVCLDVKAKAAK